MRSSSLRSLTEARQLRSIEHLAAAVRDHAFIPPPRARARGIGAEVELIPLAAGSAAPIPIEAAEGNRGIASLPWLRRLAARAGWREEAGRGGTRRFLPGVGGVVSFEPGGQLEYATPPVDSATALLSLVDVATRDLYASAADEGIELHAVGIDPFNPIERVPMQLDSARYVRMARYFETLGVAGARMMRQTAACQINLDFGGHAEGRARWRLLNAIAPYVTAIFANSAIYEGRETGYRSYRSRVWREVDPSRTGIVAGDAKAYTAFALDAKVMMKADAHGDYLSAREWHARAGLSDVEWAEHLTTLFPEVRPKGYLEIRSPDALHPRWLAAPAVLLTGLVYHAPAMHEAMQLVGEQDARALDAAGRLGLRDPAIGRTARDLAALAVAGCAALGESFIGGAQLEVAREFFARFTARGLSPADEADGAMAPAAVTPVPTLRHSRRHSSSFPGKGESTRERPQPGEAGKRHGSQLSPG